MHSFTSILGCNQTRWAQHAGHTWHTQWALAVSGRRHSAAVAIVLIASIQSATEAERAEIAG